MTKPIMASSEPAPIILPADLSIAVLAPCYNEAMTIAKVVADFRRVLPQAKIYVYDNNSTDGTAAAAAAAGAIVRKETHQGKGSVVRRMFADVDADVFVLVDGDDTYDSASAPLLIDALLNQRLDMVNGARVTQSQAAFRLGHKFGNRFLTKLVRLSFGDQFRDMLSGYRVLSRRFVKSFPALSDGFEIETELTVHALRLRMPILEIETPYFERPEGSVSKLNTFRDGFRIMRVISRMVRDEKPLEFFGAMAGVLFLVALALGAPVVIEFFTTGLVPRFPTAILAVGLVVVSVISLAIGLILDTLARGKSNSGDWLISPARIGRKGSTDDATGRRWSKERLQSETGGRSRPWIARMSDPVLLVVMALIILAPAMLNGAPFVYYDSEQYFQVGRIIFERLVPLGAETSESTPEEPVEEGGLAAIAGGRAPSYSVFLYATSVYFGMWTAAALQAAACAFFILRFFVLQGLAGRRLLMLAAIAFVAIIGGLGFHAAFMMTDVFAGCLLLAVVVFLFSKPGAWLDTAMSRRPFF